MRISDISKSLKKLCVSTVCYFDKITVWLATPDLELTVEELFYQHGIKVFLTDKHMSRYNSPYRQKLEIFQVTPSNLHIISDILYREQVQYIISRIEIAFDWVTDDYESAQMIKKIFEENFIHKEKMAYYVEDVSNTRYFARKKESKKVPVDYVSSDQSIWNTSDKSRLKMGNPNFFHFEYRLVDTQTCKSNGIVTFSDLREFNIIAYMRDQAVFAPKPSKKSIGKLLSTRQYSDRQYQKICNQALNDKKLNYKTMTTQECFFYFKGSDLSMSITKVRRGKFSSSRTAAFFGKR